MIYVVGSGPSGVACAHALLKQGLEVTMLDSGLELESQQKTLLEKLSNTLPDNWNQNDINTIKGNTKVNPSGSFVKGVYGSDFPTRETERFFPNEIKNVQLRMSLAKGGLSNIWGAALLPYIDEDIKDWPIGVKELSPHYESALSLIDLAATNDDLSLKFPLYTKKYQEIKYSNQATSLMSDLISNKNTLNSSGFDFGYSRLAVKVNETNSNHGCKYCGLCHYGCPYEAIYNSAFTLNELLKNEKFHYIKNVIVKKVHESSGEVTITATSRTNNEEITFKALRVYLACGVVPSTKIILESLKAYNEKVTMKDSQWFLIPLIRYKKVSDILNENLFTLSQVFIELFDKNLSANTINLQVYTYNDLYLRAIKNTPLKYFLPLVQYPVNELLGRLVVIMGYLHSNDSSEISVKLQKNNKLLFEAQTNNKVKTIVSGVYKKFFTYKDSFKAIPIPGITKIPPPGYGSHSGGTFPMRDKPHEFETDILGRPYGFKKVHIVDASVFPSIPATTITLTIMANAHRIASRYNDI